METSRFQGLRAATRAVITGMERAPGIVWKPARQGSLMGLARAANRAPLPYAERVPPCRPPNEAIRARGLCRCGEGRAARHLIRCARMPRVIRHAGGCGVRSLVEATRAESPPHCEGTAKPVHWAVNRGPGSCPCVFSPSQSQSSSYRPLPRHSFPCRCRLSEQSSEAIRSGESPSIAWSRAQKLRILGPC